MNYIEREDLVGRYSEQEIQHLEINISKSDVIEERVKATQSAIEDACSEIDSYIAARYPLPIPSVPNQLKHKACDIARYKLYKDQASEEVEKRYKEAISWLKDISTKKAVLVFPVGTPDPQPAPISEISGIFVV